MSSEIKVTQTVEIEKKLQITFLSCDRFVRGFIGKGGANIRRIMELTHCHLIMRGQRGCLRHVTVEGTRAHVAEGVEAVAAVMARALEGPHDLDSVTDESVMMLMLLPSGVSGPIIGKSGENINSIKQASGADLRIFTENQQSYDILIIEGTPAQIKTAMVPIATIYSECGAGEIVLTENEASFLSSHAHRCQQCFDVDREVAPILIGKSGNVIKKIRRASGAGIRVNTSDRKDVQVEVFGEQSSIEYAIKIIDIEMRLGFRRRDRSSSRARSTSQGNQRSGRVYN